MEDAEAEALLIALGSTLHWEPLPYFPRHYQCADNEAGTYIIRRNYGKYLCEFAPAVSRCDSDDWEYEPTSLGIARRACDWHAVQGVWPTGLEEGWEFAKL